MSNPAPLTRWMTPPPVYNHEPILSAPTTLRPYLQLPHLLSLTWLAYPILSLIFVVFRLQLSSSASQDAVTSAKGDLLSACKAAEQASTAVASMPRYMAAATNQQFADAVNSTMNGAREALILALTVMEAIINFIVDIYRSTFLCFLELVVRGGLAIIIGALQEFNSFLSSTLNALRTSIQNDVTTANSAITTAINAINKVNPFGNINIPQISIPSLTSLENVTLPTDFETALTNLNSSLPTVSDLKDKIDAILDTPFEALKADINNTFLGLSFDPSVLPVPEQNTLSFCGQLDTSVIDDLGNDLLKVAKIGTLIIILVILVLLAGHSALEWYKWRCLKQHLEYTRQSWLTDPAIYHTGQTATAPSMTLTDHNLLMLQANSSHPLLTRIANSLASRLRLSQSQHIHLQWFFHYVFHPPALACFLIGFFGLLSVQLQLVAVGPLEAKYQAQAASSVADFSNTIASSMNASMYNQSSFYATAINNKSMTIQTTIDNGLFGWVNGTTTTLNNTLNTFYDDIQNAVTTVFNGTILESPAQEFIKCFIGSKVDALEAALTFLNQNLNIQLPRVNESILVLSPDDVNEATKPIATAAIGGGDNNSQGVVGRLVNTYVNSLKKERIMFLVFIGLWVLVVLIALVIIFWHSYGRNLLEAHRKRRWQKEQRDGIEVVEGTFRTSQEELGLNTFVARKMSEPEVDENNDSHFNMRSFTPLPEPKTAVSFNNINPFNRSAALPATPRFDPALQKDMVSFFDNDEKAPVIAPLNIRHKKAQSDVVDEDTDSLSWLKRMKGALFNNGQPDFPSTEDNASTRGSLRARLRPFLTISIGNTTELKPHGITVEKSPRAGPTSHWSVSPTPHSVAPWKSLSPPPKVPSLPHIVPVRPPPQRNLNVPREAVDSTYDNRASTRLSKQQLIMPTPLAVPLHHAFERQVVAPQTPGTPYSPFDSPVSPGLSPITPMRPTNLAPPRDWHRRSSSVPAAAFKYAGHRDASTPGTRTIVTPARARQSAKAMPVDPFSTPFDDDASVPHDHNVPFINSRYPVPARNQNTNPFAAVAY